MYLGDFATEEEACYHAHCLNTHQMLLDALKMCVVELKCDELPTEFVKDAVFMADKAIEAASFVTVEENE